MVPFLLKAYIKLSQSHCFCNKLVFACNGGEEKQCLTMLIYFQLDMTKDSVACSDMKFNVSIIPKIEKQKAAVGFKVLIFFLSRLFQISDYDNVYVESVKVLCVFKCKIIIRTTMAFYFIEKKCKYKANVHKCIKAFKFFFF